MSELPTDDYQIYRITMDVSIPVYKLGEDGKPIPVPSALDHLGIDWRLDECTFLGFQEERLSVSAYKEVE